MNNQEAFDKVWQHFVVEKNDQAIMNFSCRYRGNNGTKCAVGCLIPDEMYDEKIEGNIWTAMIKSPVNDLYAAARKIHNAIFADVSLKLINEFQSIHDTGFSRFEERMRALAANFNLSIPGENK